MKIKELPKDIVLTIKKHPQIAIGFAAFSLLGGAMLAYYMYKNRFVRFAKKWVGEKEIAGNMGFENSELDEYMRKYGDFRDSQSWCASFVKMVVMKKVGKNYEQLIDKLITPSTQQTFNNFKNDNSGLFKITTEPKKGDIVIWQKYKQGNATFYGHMGVVEKVKKDSFMSIEGNTNSKGGREGIEVAVKERKFDFNNINGLRIKGFIHIKKAI